VKAWHLYCLTTCITVACCNQFLPALSAPLPTENSQPSSVVVFFWFWCIAIPPPRTLPPAEPIDACHTPRSSCCCCRQHRLKLRPAIKRTNLGGGSGRGDKRALRAWQTSNPGRTRVYGMCVLCVWEEGEHQPLHSPPVPLHHHLAASPP